MNLSDFDAPWRSDDSVPSVYIQWKNADACVDVRCTCGAVAHMCHVQFFYFVKCGHCGVVWKVGSVVPLVQATEKELTEGADVAIHTAIDEDLETES